MDNEDEQNFKAKLQELEELISITLQLPNGKKSINIRLPEYQIPIRNTIVKEYNRTKDFPNTYSVYYKRNIEQSYNLLSTIYDYTKANFIIKIDQLRTLLFYYFYENYFNKLQHCLGNISSGSRISSIFSSKSMNSRNIRERCDYIKYLNILDKISEEIKKSDEDDTEIRKLMQLIEDTKLIGNTADIIEQKLRELLIKYPYVYIEHDKKDIEIIEAVIKAIKEQPYDFRHLGKSQWDTGGTFKPFPQPPIKEEAVVGGNKRKIIKKFKTYTNQKI